MKSHQVSKRLVGIGVVILAILGFSIFRLVQHPVMRAYLVRWSHLVQIAPNVYVDPNMPSVDREFLLGTIAEAEGRITEFYGDYCARPVIIAGHTMDVMVEYGGNDYNRVGRTYLTPLGQYIVFGPDGAHNLNVIAHEIAHAELAQRIGYRLVNTLPDWFEEGLALQVDERFTEEDWLDQTANESTAIDLDKMGTIKHDDSLAYLSAKHELSRWLDIVGQEGLLKLLMLLEQGEDFQSSYQRIETQEIVLQPTPTPTTSLTVMPTPTKVDLTQLLPITVTNAKEIKLLQIFDIPSFNFVRETCGVAFSPNGKYLAAACMSHIVPVWEMTSGDLKYELKGSQIWSGVTFSPDSETLVSVGRDKEIYFWDMQTGEMSEILTSSSGAMNVPNFNPDGTKLAVGSFSGEAFVWDLVTKTEEVRFSGHHSRVNSVDFSPDGTMVASGGGDNLAKVWDSSTGEEIFSLSGAQYFVEDVEFSPDGQFLLAAADDSVIRIWELQEGNLVFAMRGHQGPVNGIAYHPDGTIFASCGNDGSLRLWDAGTGKLLAKYFGHEDYAIRPAFSPDGTMVATIGWDGKLILWGLSQ